MANVGEGAVEGDAVADVNVEAVLPVGLVHPVRVRQRERFALLAVTCVKHKHTGVTCGKLPHASQNERNPRCSRAPVAPPEPQHRLGAHHQLFIPLVFLLLPLTPSLLCVRLLA